jgi:hypothetical protein
VEALVSRYEVPHNPSVVGSSPTRPTCENVLPLILIGSTRRWRSRIADPPCGRDVSLGRLSD